MKLYFTFLLLLFICSDVFSQSLILNKRFGTNGIVTTNFGNDATSFVSAIAVQPDGKIIMAGDEALTRILPNGLTDSSFGESGTCFIPNFYSVKKILIQSDGKIVAINSAMSSASFIRVTVNGVIDISYGSGGQFTMNDLNGESFFVTDCAMMADNRILFLASGDGTLTGSLVIGRVLASGSFDGSFNGNGLVIVSDPNTNNRWSPGVIAVQSTGKILVSGMFSKGLDESSINLLRFNSNGSADNSFNSTGRFTYLLDPLSGQARTAIQVQGDDGILLGCGNNGRIVAIKLLANGQADPVFNGNGIALSTALFGQPINIFLRPNGKILVAGMVSPDANSDSDYGAVQFNANGIPDGGFGVAGARIISVGDNDVVVGAALQPDGALIMFGYAWNVNTATMIKVTSAGSADISFGTGGVKKLALIASDDAIVTLIEQPDKKLLAGGWKTSGFLDSSNIVITRYKADGKSFDSSFGIAGKIAPFDPAQNFLSMALQSTGKIILCSLYYPADSDSSFSEIGLHILTRFNSDGSIDNSFGTNHQYVSGKIDFHFDPAPVKVLSDDKILLCQTQHPDDGSGIKLTRLTANGLPDNSFGTGGTVILNVPFNELQNIKVQPDGKLLIAYKQFVADSTTCRLIRLLSNGSYDNSFDADGIKQVAAAGGTRGAGFGVDVTTDGKIIAPVSMYSNLLQRDFTTVYRFNNDGTPDAFFNGTGSLTIPAGSLFTGIYAQCFVLDKTGGIYLAGDAYTQQFDSSVSFICRVKSNAVVDTTVDYANNGMLFINNADWFINLNVLSDSSLLASGLREQSMYRKEGDFLMHKYRALSNGYRFIGNGNYSNPANWESGKVPPAILPAGSYVYIQPAAGGQCVLDISQQISSDDNIVVAAGKKLIITGSLIIK